MKKLLLFFALFSTLYAGDMTQITSYQSESVKHIRPLLDEWAIDAYREYPYFYVYQEETAYNAMFEEDPQAMVLIAEQDGKKVAAVYANPLNSPYLKNHCYTPAEYLDEIEANGFDPKNIYYISCFLFQKEARQDKALANLLFSKISEAAKALGKTQICYMELQVDPNHPLRPTPFYPCEPWALVDTPSRPMNVTVEMTWPTLQPDSSIREEKHGLPLYIFEKI